MARGQQAPVDERTAIPYEYPAFRDATVTMMVGSRKQVKGNVYLDGSRFYFMQDGKAIEANLGNVRRVQFGDSLYVPVNATTVGYVVAQDSGKMLVCVRTIDKYKMKGRKDGFGGRDQSGEGLAFATLDGFGGVLELDNREAMERAKRFPVQREYLFRIDGQSGGITGIVTVAVPAGAACRDSVKSCGMGCFKNLRRSPVVRQTFVFVPAGAGDIETVGFLHAFRTFCKVNVVFPEYGSGKAADFRVFRRLFRQRPETP